MNKRKVIQIDEELCIGCGLCTEACLESVIELVDGKAKVMREDHCDGLGNCLPVCPTNAISFVGKEVLTSSVGKIKKEQSIKGQHFPTGCPGNSIASIQRNENSHNPAKCRINTEITHQSCKNTSGTMKDKPASHLGQWPVQLKLAPINAPYFKGANLLIAADCTAFAYGNFHEEFIKNHITLIGCPKLDEGDYSQKLTVIFLNNEIQSIKVVRMEVPCCSGIARAVMTAVENSGKSLPWEVVTLSLSGEIIHVERR